MSLISNIIEDAATNGRGYTGNLVQDVKSHTVLSELLGIPISGYSSFTLRNQFYRDRLTNINLRQKNDILNSFGGDSQVPSLGETSDVNYNESFAKWIESDELNGDNTTRTSSAGDNSYTNINNLYVGETNLYYDENNNGTFSNKMSLTSDESILTKTKILFNNHKIKTIISSFHTSTDELPIGVAGTPNYGMSHGRNLLKKDAENGNSASNFNTNGYDNPYCRVWTHHHQYNDISKLIRPFIDDNGSPTSIGELQKDWTFIRGETGAKRLDKYSVLNKNGFVNITPSYDENEKLKVDTKHCMFSIENLAWKGYDPYSFEKALSWEQRGPMGGRIMWFPPYGIEFNENISVNWNSDVFIGRGEPVYTYVNTERSGTLSFLMLVDHPSIINYYEGSKIYNTVVDEEATNSGNYNTNGLLNSTNLDSIKINPTTLKSTNPTVLNESSKIYKQVDSGQKSPKKDTDLLRFFAGCDTIDGVAKNLTDEYTGQTITNVVTGETTFSTYAIPKPEPIIVPEIVESTGSVVFYVFYPNNYSGVDDTPGSPVEAMAYLLNGAIAQKHGNQDIPIKFSDLNNIANTTNLLGTGYEMTKNEGVSNYKTTYDYSENEMCITGTSVSKPLWKYRIDKSYYNQTLSFKTNYEDKNVSSSNNDNTLNSNYKLVASLFPSDENELYSFAEVAYLFADNTGKSTIKARLVRATGNGTEVDERIEKLQELFGKFEITKVEAIGFSNSHGNNSNQSVNQTRNNELAKNRANSVIKWLKEFNTFKKENISFTNGFTPYVEVPTQNISDINSKKWRSAKVTITYNLSENKKLAETKQTISTDMDGERVESEVGMQEYIGFNRKIDENGKEIFVDGDGNNWTMDKDGMLIRTEVFTKDEKRTYPKARTDFNNIRYDQEYRFFKVLQNKNPMVFEQLMDKIQYFDPAFHSMTPEGFNGRLGFLQQCTRQGNTIGASDLNNAKTATNLAFGRPPVCVLRIGDFYNTKVVFTNMTINYEPLQWDLNSEGIGVQPLLAKIDLTFNFIGGSDLAGPIMRLQNAMSFNYYANQSVYDNRADVIEYPESKEHVYNKNSNYNFDKDGTGIVYKAYNTKMSE